VKRRASRKIRQEKKKKNDNNLNFTVRGVDLAQYVQINWVRTSAEVDKKGQSQTILLRGKALTRERGRKRKAYHLQLDMGVREKWSVRGSGEGKSGSLQN